MRCEEKKARISGLPGVSKGRLDANEVSEQADSEYTVRSTVTTGRCGLRDSAAAGKERTSVKGCFRPGAGIHSWQISTVADGRRGSKAATPPKVVAYHPPASCLPDWTAKHHCATNR